MPLPVHALRATASGAAMVAALAAVSGGAAARVEYRFEPLGTLGQLASEPTGINDSGRVCGLLTGT